MKKTTAAHRSGFSSRLVHRSARDSTVSSLILLLIALSAALTHHLGAASLIVNGSLDGSATSHSLVPAGWSNLPQGTTDTVSASGHPFASSYGGIGNFPYAASPNGGTFTWSGDYFAFSVGQPEGLRQVVTGFLLGGSYELRFEFTNLALYNPTGTLATDAFLAGQNLDSSGRWLIALDGISIGSTATVAPAATPGSQVWSTYSQVFTATSASVTLTLTADWVSGLGTHVGMGIDGISVSQVPEPNAFALAMVTLIIIPRRRNSGKGPTD